MFELATYAGVTSSPAHAGLDCRVHPVVHSVQLYGGVLQFGGRSESVGSAGGRITSVVVRTHPGEEIAEHHVGAGGVLEHAGPVQENPQCFAGVGCVSQWVVKRRHRPSLSLSDAEELRQRGVSPRSRATVGTVDTVDS